MDSIDAIRIEAGEDGFELVLEGDFVQEFEAYLGAPFARPHRVRLRLQPAAFEFAGSQGLRELLAWRAEGEQVRHEMAAYVDPADGWPAIDDPKNPDWHANVSAIHDQRPDR